MKSFIYKDMQLMKKSLIIIVAYQMILLLIAAIIGSYFMDSAHHSGADGFIAGVISGLSVCMGCAMTYSLFNLDEKNKVNLYLNSMPGKKSDMVIARYIAITIFSVTIFLSQVLITAIMQLLGRNDIGNSLFGMEFLCLLLGIAVMCLIAPFFRKFNANKAILVSLMSWTSIGILGIIIVRLTNLKLDAFIKNIKVQNVNLIFTPICATIFIISCSISLMLDKKREF